MLEYVEAVSWFLIVLAYKSYKTHALFFKLYMLSKYWNKERHPSFYNILVDLHDHSAIRYYPKYVTIHGQWRCVHENRDCTFRLTLSIWPREHWIFSPILGQKLYASSICIMWEMHYFEIKQVLAVNCSNSMLRMKEYISWGDKLLTFWGITFPSNLSP